MAIPQLGEWNISENPSLGEEINLLRKEGDRAYETGDWATALLKYKAMTALGLTLNEKGALAEGYRKSAHVERLRGNYHKAERLYDKALDISRILGDGHGVSDVLRGLSYMRFRRGEYDGALKYDLRALEQARSIGDDGLTGKILIDIGNVHNARGSYDQAMVFYHDALKSLPGTDFFQRGRILNNMGEIYKRQGRFDEALESLYAVIKDGERTKDTNNVAWAMFAAAECLLRKHELGKALGYLDRSEELLESSLDEVGMQELLKVRGMFFKLKGEMERARACFDESIALGKRLDLPPETAASYLEYGSMLEEFGSLDEARACYGQARALYHATGLKRKEEEVLRRLEGLSNR